MMQRRSPRPTKHIDLNDRLERIHADELAEIDTARHVKIRRIARLLDDLLPEVGRVHCWFVASQLADVDATRSIRPSYLEALRDVAGAALEADR